MSYIGAQILKTVYWSSDDNRFAVVRGPFPKGFPRTLAYKDLNMAISENPGLIRSRLAQSTSNHYSKVLYRWIVPDKNDLGDIAP